MPQVTPHAYFLAPRNWWSNNFTVLDYMSLRTADGDLEIGVVNLTMVYKPMNLTSEQVSFALRGGQSPASCC